MIEAQGKNHFSAHSPCLLLWSGASQNSCNTCPTCGICPLCCYCVSMCVWVCAQARGFHHILLPAPLQNSVLHPVSKKWLSGMEMAGNVASPGQQELVEVLAEIRAWMPSLQPDRSLYNSKGKGTALRACVLLGWGSLSQVCQQCCKLLLHHPC